jgi:hypothetical protein
LRPFLVVTALLFTVYRALAYNTAPNTDTQHLHTTAAIHLLAFLFLYFVSSTVQGGVQSPVAYWPAQ